MEDLVEMLDDFVSDTTAEFDELFDNVVDASKNVVENLSGPAEQILGEDFSRPLEELADQALDDAGSTVDIITDTVDDAVGAILGTNDSDPSEPGASFDFI